MKLKLKTLVATLLVIGVCAAFWVLIRGNSFDVLQPAGSVGMQQRNLIIFASVLSLLVVIPVFAMTFWITWKYRVSNTRPSDYKPNWGTNKVAEIIWWGIPILLIVVIGTVIWISSHQLDPYRKLDSAKPALKVQVIALQWRWLFIYPEQGVASLNYLPLPVDRPIDFEITSDAPMNSFWIPKLGGQVYAMSGMSTQLHLEGHTTGDYTGKSANISGEGYSNMVFTTRVSSQSDFDTWIKDTKTASQPLSLDGYAELAKPTQDSQPKTFKLTTNTLYDTVVMKYMMPGHSGAEHHHE